MKTAEKTSPLMSPVSPSVTSTSPFVTNILRLLVWITSSISVVSCIFWISWSCYVGLGGSVKPDGGLAPAAAAIFFAIVAWLTSLAVPKHVDQMARKIGIATMILLAIAFGFQMVVGFLFALEFVRPWFGPW